jgi:hypothetical protein
MIGWPAVLAAIITVFFGGIMLESYKRHRDLQGVASALAGEIFSIIYISRTRQNAKNFAFLLANLRAGQTIDWPDITGGDPNQEDPVVKANLDRIGLLPRNIPQKIATFYAYMRGIRIDIMNLSRGAFKSPEAQANIVSADLTIWEEASRLGDDLCQELRDVALTPWPPIAVLKLVWRWLKFGANLLVVRVQRLIPERFKVWVSAKSRLTIEAQQQIAMQGSTLTQALPGPVSAQNFAPEFRDMAAEVSDFIERETLPNALPNFNGDRAQALKHLLIDYQSALALERASRLLFGSQVDALTYILTVSGTATRLEVTRYYDAAKTTYPDIYTSYSFDGWLGFLVNGGLIVVNGDMVSLTALGKAEVRYMRDRGYLLPHPRG